jgi:N-methylhydantoinase A
LQSDAAVAPKSVRQAHFGSAAPIPAKIYQRGDLAAGARIEGPAIVEQFDATTVIPAGWTAQSDKFLNLILEQAR